MVQNLYSLGLLRNGKIFENKEIAIQGLKQAGTNDGVAKLARYLGDDNNIKTVVGFYANADEMEISSGGTSYYTVLDVEGNASDIQELNNSVDTINQLIGDGIPSKSLTEAINEINATFGNGITSSHTVSDALSELQFAITNAMSVTMEVSDSPDYAKVYTIKQGGVEVGEIQIPKDIVIKSGSLVYGVWSGDTFYENTPEHTYGDEPAIKLVLNNDEVIYINAKDLVDVYTAGNGIAVNNNIISVVAPSNSDVGIINPIYVDEDGVKFTTFLDCGYFDIDTP